MGKAAGLWTSCFNFVLDAVFPPQCPLCTSIGHAAPCDLCREEFVPHEFPERGATPDLAYQISIYPYEGRPGQAVRRLKYSRCTSLAPFLSEEIEKAIVRFGLDPDLIVPVPIHLSRKCLRGFNQAELLCRRLDATPHALKRCRRTRPQVGLTEKERLRNLQDAFKASPIVYGKRILLIDDVLTSGQTARECARALRAAGAREVGFLAFCGEASGPVAKVQDYAHDHAG